MKKLACLLLVLALLTGCQKAVTETQAPDDEKPEISMKTLAPQEMAEAFVNDFVTENDEALLTTYPMTKDMKAALTLTLLQQIRQGLQQNAGQWLNHLETSQVTVQGYQGFILGALYEKETIGFQVLFDAEGLIAGFTFVPYTGPGSETGQNQAFTTEDMTFGLEAWPISGTLYKPNTEENFPLVILVHGSGPNDRYETIGPNAPFKDIAEDLASHGIGVLTYDKRSLTHGAQMAALENMTVH